MIVVSYNDFSENMNKYLAQASSFGLKILPQKKEKRKFFNIRGFSKTKSQPVVNERLEALKSIQGVLKDCEPITISEIREQRLSERYGL